MLCAGSRLQPLAALLAFGAALREPIAAKVLLCDLESLPSGLWIGFFRRVLASWMLLRLRLFLDAIKLAAMCFTW